MDDGSTGETMKKENENNSAEKKCSRWAIRPLVPEEVYTNRKEHIDYLYNAAIKAITRRTMSTVLLGKRRMGKTEIFKRVVNRLFFKQENYHDLNQSVVPVYYSFRDTVADRWDFSVKYVENFLRWYVAFRLRDPRVLSDRFVSQNDLPEMIGSRIDLPEGAGGAIKLMSSLVAKRVTMPEEEALMLPRGVSDWDDSTVIMFLDEFQNTRLPQYNFDIVGLMQEAVESPTCPHFVTGSAMSILAREILNVIQNNMIFQLSYFK